MDITHTWNLIVVHPLMLVLKQLADLTNSGGLAIILMTLGIKTILLPLSLQQTRSMKNMQSLQPEIAALKKKYKDREKITQETMRLYKERGVNPTSGCLPMVPTMIVLIGLYGALINLAQCDPNRDIVLQCDERFREPFLWLPQLDHPDAFHLPGLPFALPGILPVAMAISQFFSSRMMSMPTQDPQQAAMNRMTTVIFPAMMLFWGITFPAGLVLYWFVSNLYEMVRLYFTMGPQRAMAAAGGASAGSFGGFGGFGGFGSLFGRPSASDETDSQPTEDKLSPEISGDGPRANGRSSRPRSKRGRRSGRR